MKTARTILIVIVIMLLLPFAANAEEPGSPDVQTKVAAQEIDGLQAALPEEARGLLENVSPNDVGSWKDGFGTILANLKENAFGIFKNALKSAVKILCIVLLCALSCSILDNGGVRDAVSLGGTVAVSAVAIGDMSAFFGMGISTLQSLSAFSRVLLPAMCTAAASSGALTSASAKFAATTLFMDLLISLGMKIIVPLIGMYLVSVIAGAALGRDMLAKLSKLLGWLSKTALILLVSAFTTYLSLSGIISGKADEMAARVTKSALGAVLPVVGSIVSDAAGTVVAGAGILRNALGVFGLIAVLAICVGPFLSLGAQYLVYKGTAALTEALTDRRMSDLIDGIGTAFGMVLALVGAGGIMLFISLISSMKAVTGL